jgi:hypothetical protein
VAERAPTGPDDGELVDAVRYATAIRSATPLPVIAHLPLPLAPKEAATLRAVVIYERRYPMGDATTWGDRHGAAVIATTDRLLVSHRLRGWLSFWLDDLDTLELELDTGPANVELTWRHGELPLRLSGPSAATVAVHVAAHHDRDGWYTMAAFQPFLTPVHPS